MNGCKAALGQILERIDAEQAKLGRKRVDLLHKRDFAVARYFAGGYGEVCVLLDYYGRHWAIRAEA